MVKAFLAAGLVVSIGAAARTGSPKSALAGGRVETIDARTIEGDVAAVTAERVTVEVAAGRKQTIPLGDVAEIVLSETTDLMARRGKGVLFTSWGDRLAVSDLTLAAGKISFVNPMLARAQLDIGAAAAIYQAMASLTPRQIQQRCREMGLTGRAKDVLLLTRKKKDWLVVEGVLEAIGPEKIRFSWKQKRQEIPRKIAPVMLLAAVGGGAGPQRPAGTLIGRCGSKLGFTAIAMDADSVTADLPGLGSRKIPRESVASIRFQSRRIVNLADLKPIRVKEHGFFDRTFPYRINRSVGGGELRLGRTVFRTGLGLHSRCELTYRLEGKYSKFVAIVGIDDSVRPVGDATVTFLADGKVRKKPLHVTGRTDPQKVSLDMRGAKELTIRVDFGPDGLDVGDHVDLCAARFIK